VLGQKAVASLQLDPKSGRYYIRFYYGGQEYKRSIKTKNEVVARGFLGRVEETVQLLEQGWIEMPADADPGRFILSDGKHKSKAVVQKLLTLDDLFTLYRLACTLSASTLTKCSGRPSRRRASTAV
jgi:hypothetical protein